MIECVHAYWLFLWLIGLFSRYSHRNCIINYPLCCHGGTMESPDEYLGRLNFPGACGVKGHRGALLRWRNGRRCVLVCWWCARGVCAVHQCLAHQHTQAGLPPPSHWFCLSISLLQLYQRGVGRWGATTCLCTSFSKWWTFLSDMPRLILPLPYSCALLKSWKTF